MCIAFVPSLFSDAGLNLFCCLKTGQDSPLIVKTLLGLATTYTDLDENPKAIETYERVLVILERTRGPNDETLALPLSHLGHSLLEEGRVDEAELSMLRFASCCHFSL